MPLFSRENVVFSFFFPFFFKCGEDAVRSTQIKRIVILSKKKKGIDKNQDRNFHSKRANGGDMDKNSPSKLIIVGVVSIRYTTSDSIE